jgi:hypothetical protein
MDKFCLVHIPKTAGVSLWSFLKSEVFGKNSAEHFNDYDDSGGMYCLDEILKKNLIVGHIDYEDIKPRLSKDFKIGTILRDPIDRCISWYKYSSLINNLNINEHNKEYSLEDVYKSNHKLNQMYMHNTITWQLGDHLDPDRRTKTPEEALQFAKHRILNMDDVLFFNYFKDSVVQLCDKYKWDVNFHKIPWINPTIWMEADITDNAVENLRSINSLDEELMYYAYNERGMI